jgi:large subunit ribosomal protein L25
MSEYKLSAKPRKIFGRKVRALRLTGVTPGNVFGKKTKSVSVQLSHKELLDIIRKAGETSLIDLTIEGETKARPVLISGYAQDSVSGALLHVDFHQVDLTVKTTADVPVETVGESPAVAEGNVLVLLKQEIEVEALPADLPDQITVDISGLAQVGDTVVAKDLKLDRSKITLALEDEEPIVTIQEPAKEEEPEPTPAEEGEGTDTAAAPEESAESPEGSDKPAESESSKED